MSWAGQWAGQSAGRWYGYTAATEPEPEVPQVLASGGLSWPLMRRQRPAVDEIDEENVRLIVATLH